MSMGKQKAFALAREERITFGELRAMIDKSRALEGISSLNKSLTHTRCCEVLLAAIAERPAHETPKAWRPDPYSRSGKMKPSKDFLIVTNILRECAQ